MGQGLGPAHRLTAAERLALQDRVRAGESHRAAAISVGCSAKSVQRLLWKTGGVKPRTTPRSALRLSLPEREEISRGLMAGDSCRMIARRFGRAPSTVSRAVAASGACAQYRAWRADAIALRRAHRPKTPKLLVFSRQRVEVERGLTRAGRRSRSRRGYATTFPTTWRCACRMRQSISHSSCKGVARSARR